VKLLVEAGMVHALVCLANLDTALLTDTSKELLCRYVYIAGAYLNQSLRAKFHSKSQEKMLPA